MVRPPLRGAVAGQVLAALAQITDDVEGDRAGNMVLVVDDEALRVLNACLPADALVKAGFISAWGRGAMSDSMCGRACAQRSVQSSQVHGRDDAFSARRCRRHARLAPPLFLLQPCPCSRRHRRLPRASGGQSTRRLKPSILCGQRACDGLECRRARRAWRCSRAVELAFLRRRRCRRNTGILAALIRDLPTCPLFSPFSFHFLQALQSGAHLC